jgi:hypothetical protein
MLEFVNCGARLYQTKSDGDDGARCNSRIELVVNNSDGKENGWKITVLRGLLRIERRQRQRCSPNHVWMIP